jgi:hypothetical protein
MSQLETRSSVDALFPRLGGEVGMSIAIFPRSRGSEVKVMEMDMGMGARLGRHLPREHSAAVLHCLCVVQCGAVRCGAVMELVD